LYIALEMEFDRRDPGRGHHLAALLASERARARGLLDLLHTARLKITAGVDAQLLARERQLTSAVEQAGDRLTRLLTAKAKPDAVQVAERELDGLIAELSELQRQLQVQSPQYAALTQPPALDVAGIQRLLDADSILLEYSLGTIRSYAWVVTPDAVTSVVLPGRADIEQAARRAYDLIARGARRDTKLQTRRALESLAELVLAPVAPLLTRRRVIVVPDAGLHYVPFAALPKPDASRASSSAEPLIVHHEVVMLPSASALDALRKMDRSQAPAPREVAVFADPVLRRDDPRLTVAAAARPRTGTRAAVVPDADEALRSLDRLPFTRAEANAIASLTPGGRTLKALDFSASRATALAELGSARIVHFATHALIDGEQPDRSGIVLSLVDRDGAAVDGFLKLHDIYNLQLNADLVVLSACRTALGKELRGEGLIGLTRGFFYAGVPAVVASLWDVRDRSTAELMTRFYRAMLQDHLAPAAALRAAQVSMLRDPRWSAPAHWSGFILRGDWRENRR
jgi:CHAT domain-containing protein